MGQGSHGTFWRYGRVQDGAVSRRVEGLPGAVGANGAADRDSVPTSVGLGRPTGGCHAGRRRSWLKGRGEGPAPWQGGSAGLGKHMGRCRAGRRRSWRRGRGEGPEPRQDGGRCRSLRQGRGRRGSQDCRERGEKREKGRGSGEEQRGEEGIAAVLGRRAVLAVIAVRGPGVRGGRRQVGGGQGAVPQGVRRVRGIKLTPELGAEGVQLVLAEAVAVLASGPGGSHIKVAAPGRVRKAGEVAHLLGHRSPVVVPQKDGGGVSPVASVAIKKGKGRGVGDSRADGGRQGGGKPGDDGERVRAGGVVQVVGRLDGREDKAVLQREVRVIRTRGVRS